MQEDLGHIIEEWFLEILEQDLRRNVSKKFWSLVNNEDQTNVTSSADRLSVAFDYLHEVNMGYLPCVQRLESMSQLERLRRPATLLKVTNLSDAIILLVKANILSAMPQSFQQSIDEFYSQAFRVFHHSTSEEDEPGRLYVYDTVGP